MKGRLFRSRKDRQLAGVCGGLAEWLGLDPTIVRLGFVLLALTGVPAPVIYLALAICVPEDRRKIKFEGDLYAC